MKTIKLTNILFLILILCCFNIILAFPLANPNENIEIVLSFPSSNTSLEASFVIPNNLGKQELLKGNIQALSSNQYVSSSGVINPETAVTKEVFKIRKFISGTYKLWIHSNQETNFHNQKIKVEIFKSGKLLKTFIPKTDKTGLAWLPLEIDGYTGQMTEINKIYSRLNTIHGNVCDAVTGERIKNTIIIIQDRGSQETITRLFGDKNGNFIQPVNPGRYTVYIGKKGYISDKFDIDIVLDFPVTIQATLSKIIPLSGYRIIMTWDRYPIDLDAHLKGPNPTHEDFHIYQSNQTLIQGKNFLDKVDQKSFGPETITIPSLNPGIYTYTIYNNSGSQDTSGSALADGNVIVKIYTGNNLIKRYRLPKNSPGNFWKVFQIYGDSGKIIDINQTGFESNPENL